MTPGNESSSNVGGISVEVIGMVADAMSMGSKGVRDGTFG